MSNMDPITLLATPPKPPPPPAKIRPFNRSTDFKVSRYLIGASIMEPSSVANKTALWTIPSAILSIFISHIVITNVLKAGWLPQTGTNTSGSFWSYFEPTKDNLFHLLLVLPVLCAPPIILLALFELRHRNYFEEEMKRGVGEEDMRDIVEYYSVPENEATNKAREGFWVLEYDERIIGAISLDAKNPTKALASTVDLAPPSPVDPKAIKDTTPSTTTTATSTKAGYSLRQRNKPATSTPTATPSTLQIRRFATSMSFRPAGIEEDLLDFVTAVAFSPSTSSSAPAKNLVISFRPAVEKSLLKRLEMAGFVRTEEEGLVVESMGEEESKKRKEMEEKKWVVRKLLGSALERVWVVDLGKKTFVLSKETWERKQKK